MPRGISYGHHLASAVSTGAVASGACDRAVWAGNGCHGNVAALRRGMLDGKFDGVPSAGEEREREGGLEAMLCCAFTARGTA